MSEQTSPFSGFPGIRMESIPGTPPQSFVFSGSGGNPAASSFIEGFIRPGGDGATTQPEGLLPSILFNNTGGTYNTTVPVDLSPLEEGLIASNPNLARKLGNWINGNKLIAYGLVFVVFYFLFKRWKV